MLFSSHNIKGAYDRQHDLLRCDLDDTAEVAFVRFLCREVISPPPSSPGLFPLAAQLSIQSALKVWDGGI